MSVTRLIILGVGFVAAILSAMLVAGLTSAPSDIPQQAAVEPSIQTTDILVARKRINRGDEVGSGDLEWVAWPSASVRPTHITKRGSPDARSEYAGSTARFIMEEGDPVHPSKFVANGQSFMAAVIAKGKRAVATNISPGTGAGGFILPDDKVDVVMTRTLGTEGGEQSFVSEPVLTNVRVLAIDQIIQEQDGEPVVVGKTATLELDEKQVQALTVAQQMADQITLALRSLEDAGEENQLAADHLLGATSKNSVKVVRHGKSTVVRTK